VGGRVVLVDCWTYTCINWLRTLGYVRARAENALRVESPIALDSDYQAGALPFGCKVDVQTIASHS
jgi:hypothetical protein